MPTKRVDLVDARGKTRAALDLNKDGPGLYLLDAAGNIRVLLDLTQDGPRLRLGVCLPATIRVIAAAAISEAFAELMRSGEAMKYAGDLPALMARIEKKQVEMEFAKNARADLRVMDAGYSLDLRNAAGEPQAGPDSDKNSACLNLVDAAADSFRAVLDREMNMNLRLYDAEGKFHEVLGMDAAPPTVELRDTEEKVRGVLSVGTANLNFFLHDAGGNLRASLAVGIDGRRLRLYDGAGKVRVRLNVDKDGLDMALFDAAGLPIWQSP